MSGVRGRCEVCRRVVSVRQDGLLWIHRGHFRTVCPGSQTPPASPTAGVVYGPPCDCLLCHAHNPQPPGAAAAPGHFRKDTTP